MLSDDDLRYMREVQQDHLPVRDAVRHQRLTAADGLGGQGEAWAPTSGVFAARVTDASSDLPDDLVARLKGNDGYTVTIPWDQPMEYRDRVTVAGAVYEVLAIDGGGSWNTAKRLLCVKVA